MKIKEERRLVDLEGEYSDVVAFAKILIGFENWKKNHSSRIHPVLTKTMVLCF